MSDMDVTITHRGDPSLTVRVAPSTTMGALKLKVEEAMGYVAVHQQLYALDRPRRPLRDSETLAGAGVADGASLRVGAPDAARVAWGAAPLVFDDSHEHDVIHAGADPRIVLILDAWHPDLPPGRRRFELYGRLS